MYIERVTIAGKTKEIEKYYTYRTYAKGGKRPRRKETSSEKQKEANDRQAVKKLRQLMNANFNNDCFYITLEYFKEEGKDYVSPEEMRQDMKNFLSRLRKIYQRQGSELRYIWVAAIGQRSARHFHLVINDLPGYDYKKIRGEIQRIWNSIYLKRYENKSQAHIEYLYGDNYGQLAAYFIKQSKITFETIGKKIGKRWNSSQNLKQPVVIKKIIGNKSFKKEPKAPRGYYIDKAYTRMGIGSAEYGGYEYMSYILIKMEGCESEHDARN